MLTSGRARTHLLSDGVGALPVEEFLASLNPKQAQKVAWVLQLAEELDLVPVQYFKKLVG